MEEYQVNVSTNMDDGVTVWISRHLAWCVFTGTYQECEAYIAEHY